MPLQPSKAAAPSRGRERRKARTSRSSRKANRSPGLAEERRLLQPIGLVCRTDGHAAIGQRRMPNANELESLVDVSQANPAVSSGHPFTHIAIINAYWSSTT